jgi:L-2-hydroxyglutarate oxidase LhgO
LAAKGAANGVYDLKLLDRADVVRMEPEVQCVAALHSPSSGIIDTHAFMMALRGEAEDHGAVIALSTPLIGGEAAQVGILLRCGGSEPITVATRIVINAAGLSAPAVAHSIAGVAPATIPSTRFAKGNYFKLERRAPFSRLVYPVPEPGGLGVHATLDMGGQLRFGPDVEWIEEIDYNVKPERSQHFYSRIRDYWPELRDGSLSPDYSGIRPKVVFDGAVQSDFIVSGPADHGVPGLVNLYGIESPGLTASLAIAELVDNLISGDEGMSDYDETVADQRMVRA